MLELVKAKKTAEERFKWFVEAPKPEKASDLFKNNDGGATRIAGHQGCAQADTVYLRQKCSNAFAAKIP
jgi:hypothetical protein